jgi:hypothetical protein
MAHLSLAARRSGSPAGNDVFDLGAITAGTRQDGKTDEGRWRLDLYSPPAFGKSLDSTADGPAARIDVLLRSFEEALTRWCLWGSGEILVTIE